MSTDSSIYSFEPIADDKSRVLILGTIPGKESLRQKGYYAHPQNAFWKILFELYKMPYSTDYCIKREMLLQNGIALWDVLRNCERKSSLDNDIKLENPNDLHQFLLNHPGIKQIFFNGQSAARYFVKYFSDISLPHKTLPSTSPAHAIKWDQKLAAWQAVIIKQHK